MVSAIFRLSLASNSDSDGCALLHPTLKTLADALVMSDHPHTGHDGSEPISLSMQQHPLARDALREAVLDARPSVHDIAVSLLASLSDKESLELIDQGVQKGIYSPVQAVNYLGLADPDVSAEHIAPYLSGPNATAQVAAVSYLGANPSYQPLIKERFLDSSVAPDEARTVAANTLARYDARFSTYAESALENKTLPPAALVPSGHRATIVSHE